MSNKLSDQTEVLFRQVHPAFYQGGKLGSPAFMPNSSDNGLMSLDRASKTDPKSAHTHYTQHLGKQSACVFGVSVGEFTSEKIECIDDPLLANGLIPANPAHSLADYNPHGAKEQKLVAKRLKVEAEKRGCLYP